ncbi:MAG: hypothetical protein K8R92_08265 [Planctomycetes bacterium]|nr:hypothetical protein [Planctomycetota bacterium]
MVGLLTGFAAGIALLEWRDAPYASIETANSRAESTIRNGEIGVEQVRPERTEFENYVGRQGHRIAESGYQNSWRTPEYWIGPVLFLFIFVFFGLGLACRAPKWMAPKAARIAFRGTDGSAATALWKDTLRRSIACMQGPSAIAAAILTGFAVIVACDLREFWLKLAGTTYTMVPLALPEDVESLLIASIIVPYVIVVIVARWRIKRNPEMTRLWCARCGYSLRALSSDPSGAVCCPECGCAVPQSPDAQCTARRLAPAIAVSVTLALLLAAHHWAYKLEDLWNAGKSSRVIHSNGIYVTVSGVVRMQCAYGTIWFRVDPVDPYDGGSLTFDDVALRVVAELRDTASPPSDPKTIRKIFTIKVNDPNWVKGVSRFTWTTIADLGKGNHMYLTADWNDTNLVLISLFPPCATSIKAIDPSTAPPFD